MNQALEAFVGVEIPKRQEELLFVTEVRPIGKLLGLGISILRSVLVYLLEALLLVEIV